MYKRTIIMLRETEINRIEEYLDSGEHCSIEDILLKICEQATRQRGEVVSKEILDKVIN